MGSLTGRQKFWSACALALLASACGKLNVDVSNPQTTGDSLLPLIRYQVVGSCSTQLGFQSIALTGLVLWTDPQAPLIVGNADLFLKDDSTFVMNYAEWIADAKTYETQITGAYTYSNGHLVIGDIATADVAVQGTAKISINLKFTRDVQTAGLKDLYVGGHMQLASDGLQTRDEYCASQASRN